MTLVWIITAALAAVVATAERIHARRVTRVRSLIFGRAHRPGWAAFAAPPLRVFAVAALAWGTMTLLVLPGQTFDKAADDPGRIDPATLKRVVFLVDVSPSMNLPDADGGRQARGARAADVVLNLLDRLAFDRTRVSVVAFWTRAVPVVVDTTDPNLIRHALTQSSLNRAFRSGQTDLGKGIRGAFELLKNWRPNSTTLVVLSDGDSTPDFDVPPAPAAVDRIVLIGVGDTDKGTFLDGHISRQEPANFARMAGRVGGTYFNADRNLIPDAVLADATGRLGDVTQRPESLRVAAVTCVAVGSGILVLLPLALARFGRVAVVAGGSHRSTSPARVAA